jgi:N4-(beta-N-acetylglucosaminyl)-L-asparaginase
VVLPGINGMETLKRIKARTVEKRLLDPRGLPSFNVKFYVVSRSGDYAGLSLFGGANSQFALCTEKGPETLVCDPLIEAPPPQTW